MTIVALQWVIAFMSIIFAVGIVVFADFAKKFKRLSRRLEEADEALKAASKANSQLRMQIGVMQTRGLR